VVRSSHKNPHAQALAPSLLGIELVPGMVFSSISPSDRLHTDALSTPMLADLTQAPLAPSS
jgi:hypothetical protein